MHEIAEYGIAAHALYKDGGGSPTEHRCRAKSSAYAWLRRTIELLAEGSNPEEFLEHTKLELFHDQVFCFTPKGKLIALPRRATPIDFAYAVHTDVGNTAVGCKINGKIAPLVSELQNGDEVEIITSKAQTAPPAAWESIVVTGKARAAIRRATRAAVRTQYAGLGRRIVERLFQRAKMAYSDEKLAGALPRLARASVEDVMAAVGRGEMKASDVVRAMYPDYKEERAAAMAVQPKPESGWFGFEAADVGEVQGARERDKRPGDPDPRHQRRSAGALRAEWRRGAGRPHRRHPDAGRGHHDLSDPVAGADGVRRPAGALARRALGRSTSAPQRFPARIAVQSVNEPGSLAQIAQVIAEHDGNIDNIRMTRSAPDFTEVTIDLEVYDLKHLNGDHRAVARQAGRREGRAGERVASSTGAPHSRSASTSTTSPPSAMRAAARHPDPVRAAELAVAAGADGITAHLREDRRHIRDDDIERLKAEIAKPLNFEMAATDEMVGDRAPDQAARRLPRAGEARGAHHRGRARRRRAARRSSRRSSRSWATPASASRCSSRPSRAQIEAAATLRRAGGRAPHRRLVRGAGATATTAQADDRMASAFATARDWRGGLGLEVHAGHGLDYDSAETIAALAADRRTQHRPLPGRRGDLRRA